MGVVGLVAAQPAPAQVPSATAAFSGYGTGSTVHASLLDSSNSRLANVDEAYSGAAVNSQGLTQINSEGGTVVQAANSAKYSGAIGSGLEAAISSTIPVANPQVAIAGRATAVAPPSTGLIDKPIGPIDLSPIAVARLLDGQAQARWAEPGGCILGADLSHGFGDASDVQLLGSGQGANFTAPTVSTTADASSTSRLVFVPQQDLSGNTLGGGAGVGLMSEVVEKVAPIQLLNGAIEIDVVAPLILRAIATGVQGGAYVTYGTTIAPTAPLVLVKAAGNTVASITFQQILGNNGLTVGPIAGILISIGSPPHAIGGNPGTDTAVRAPDGTSASGAVDLIRVSVGPVTDIRAGHMEASATVPAGGVLCQIDVSKVAQPQNVNPGDSFTYTISVHNPHSCVLTGVKVVDNITATSGVRFSILGETPPANSSTPSTLTWNDIGPIQPGATVQLVVNMKVASNSGGGVFTEKADVTASCAIANAQGTTTVQVPAAGTATIQLPTISGGQGAALPVTGGQTGRYYAVALVMVLAAAAFGRRGLKALLGSKG